MTGSKLKYVLFGLVGLNLAAIGWFAFGSPLAETAALNQTGKGAYDLTVTDGSRFTEATLRAGPSAVFFGFTHCPEVCPTTLGDVMAWQEDAGDIGDLRVFFVTVDPERDTAEILSDYVGWVPGVVGVTGAPDQVAQALEAFNIYAAKVPLEGGDYTMDHTASVLLFDANGDFSETISYGEDYDSAIAKVRRALNRS